MRRLVTPVCILLLYTVGFDLTLLAQVRGLAPARAAAPARLGIPSLPSPTPVAPPAPAAEPSPSTALEATAARVMVAQASPLEALSRMDEPAGPGLDLRTWSPEGAVFGSDWSRAADGRSAVQRLGTEPTFLVSPDRHINTVLRARMGVPSANAGGGFIGLAFGYRSPVAADGHEPDAVDLLLFDWKRQTEVRGGATAVEGFTLSRLRGRVADSWTTFGAHAPGPGLELLAARQGRGTGWKPGREYAVEVAYRKSRVRIAIDGEVIFDVRGSFPDGRVGLFAYAQAGATFRDVSLQAANAAPVADAGDDKVAYPAEGCAARVALDGAASSDPDEDALTYAWHGAFGTAEGRNPVVSLAPGTHTVDLTVDDGAGATATDAVEVTVADQQAPALTCPAAVSLTAAPPVPTAQVPLGTPAAADHCGLTGVSHDGPAAFPVGTTRVNWTASDAAGNVSTCVQTVTVAAPEAPSLSVSLTEPVLWSPDHAFVDVGLTVVASDPSGARPTVNVTVYSDEPEEDQTGDGNHEPDARIEAGRLSLRAERKGDADGRVYLLAIAATNPLGVTTYSCAAVVVPHDNTAEALQAVQAQAAAALAHCAANGTAPDGYHLLTQGPFPVTDPTLPVRPIVECVLDHGDGSLTALFGYENENRVPVYLALGPDNGFAPLPLDRGQPTAFQPGRTPADQGAVAVRFNGALAWTVRGTTVVASAGSPRCTSPLATPDAQDDQATTLEDDPVVIAVLANDTDPQGDFLRVLRVSPAAQGTAALNPDGTVTYTAPAGFIGVDGFTYTVTDGKVGTDQAIVTVTVLPRNQPPSVNAGPDQTITTASASLLGTVSDDGRPVGVPLAIGWTLVSGPAEVSFSDTSSVVSHVQFTLAGTYVLRLSASDSLLSASDEVTVTVVPSVSVEDLEVAEGQAGLSEAILGVTLSVASAEPVSVDFATADGTAAAFCDYLARVGTVAFAPGETRHEVVVPVVGELAGEADETVRLTLGNVAGAAIRDGEGTLLLLNDDAPNSPPDALASRAPADGATALGLDPTLSWTASDPDGDALTHDVYFGTSFGTGGQSWTRLCPTAASPTARAAAAHAYDEATDRLIVFGGQTGPEQDAADVWVLAQATGAGGAPAWSALSAAGGPSARRQASGTHDPATGRFIVHGGCSGACASALADTWVLTEANGLGSAPEWRELPAAPLGREGHAAAYDAARNRLIVFGGSQGASGADLSDVWVLQDANGLGSPTWLPLTPSGPAPAARRNATAVYDPASNRLIVFGGRSGLDTVLSDVWILSHANGLGGAPAWTPFTPAGRAPAPRWGHSAAYDAVSRRMLVFGGTGVGLESDRNLVANDLWLLTDADGSGSPEWTRLAPLAGPPEGRFLSSAAYSTTLNRLAVTQGANNRLVPGLRDDLWVLGDAVGSLPLVSAGQAGDSYVTATPAVSETYYWRILTRDVHGAVTGSAVWRFRPNAPPAVDAGPDRTVLYPATSANLHGTVSDDGLPTGMTSTLWTLVSGPGTVTFTDETQVDTTVAFSRDGVYVLRLTGTDGELSAADEATVTVTARPSAGRTYTSNADFDEGTATALVHSTPDQLQLDGEPRQFGFLWVAVSTKGTAVKIDTVTGAIRGEYRTAPQGQPTDPSRTTVDLNGNVWTANRAGNSVVHIGLVENGQCVDRNGNGVIETSTGQNDLRAWTNAGGANTNGGVSTAADECIIHYTRVNSAGTRHVSVDANNDVWVSGTSGQRFDLIDGTTGAIKRSELSVGFGGYGGLIDKNGVIWSARNLLRWDTSRPLTGPNGGNWRGFFHDSYGLCIDSQGNVWETALSGNTLRKWAPDGTLLGSFPHGHSNAQGCAVDQNDDVWVAHSILGSSSVGHVKNNGAFVGVVTVGSGGNSGPTGVSVDSAGKVWATNYNTRNVARINPLGGPIGADGVTRVGAVDFTTVDLGGNPYNYSDMTGSTLSAPPDIGTWSVVFDSAIAAAEWGAVTWNASVCGDGALSVTAASSANGVSFSAPQPVTPGADLSVPNGRYVRVTVTFRRATTGETPVLYDLSVGTVGYPLLPPTPSNAAPSVDAGPDQSVMLPRKASLEGTVCDDGRPGVLSTSWEQLSGPGTATFTPVNGADTQVAFSAPGSYVLRLTGRDTELTSTDDVTVTAAAPVCVAPPADMVGWWPGDGNPNDVVNGRRGTLAGGMGFAAGMVAQAFSFDGVDDSVTVPASAELNVGSSALGFTLDTWVFPTAVNVQRPILEWGQAGTIGVHLWLSFSPNAGNSPGTLYANVADTAGVGHTIFTGPGVVALNQWSHVALTYDRTSGQARLYVNGQPLATLALGMFVPRTALPLNLGFRAPSGPRFAGRMDEVEVFRRPLTPLEIEDIYLAGALGKCKTPNDRPIVDAGPDQVLILPVNTTTLSGSFTDDGRPPGGPTVAWSQVSGPGTAVFGTPTSLQTTATFPVMGVYVLKLTVNDSELAGNDDVIVTVNPRSDLSPGGVDVTGVVYEGQTLEVSGTAAVEVANVGAGPAGGPFSVALFEDRNGNGTFEAGTDGLLGTAVLDDLAPGATAVASAPLSGNVLFRGNLIHAFVDSTEAIPEGNEANNYASSAPACETAPSGRPFSPRLEWSWTLPSGSNQVMMAPVVADLTDDGVPDVVFSTFTGGNYTSAGQLRAVRGDTGALLLTVTNSAHLVTGAASVAVGDIDGDGRPEILAVHDSGNKIIAFEHDGTFKWLSAALQSLQWAGPAIADLDGNGVPEIVVGNQVLNANGTLRWTGTGGRAGVFGPLSLVADLDMDGRPEVVAGNTAYLASGAIHWRNTAVPDGFNAVANFDADPFPEIVLVAGGSVRLLEHTGAVKWGPVNIPLGGQGGPPTVGDFDGDGQVEIGVAGASRYVVLETNGTIKWQAVIQDASSNVTGSAVFDFEGDGSTEVVYADERMLRVYRGSDGVVLWEAPRPSGTTYELPIVVDVDGDGRAEIVVPSNNYAFAGPTGLQVYGDDNWVATRRIWNQHTYHVTNVNDDGTIPTREPNNWETYNNYRQNRLTSGCEVSKPDLTASFVRTAEVGGALALTVRLGNGGGSSVAAGVAVSFYDGDPASGGELLGTALSTAAVAAGRFEDVTLAVPIGTVALPLWVVADDQGGLVGTIAESDETNNVYDSGVYLTAAPNEAPVVDAGPARSATLPAGTVVLDGQATDDGLPVDQLTVSWSVVSGPGPVSFGDATATDTSATFTVPGSYLLRLTADDADLRTSDDVTVTIHPANQAPSVNAGPDQSITTSTTTLAGTVTDDGLPAGNTLTIAWTVLSGPATVTFGQASAATTTAAFAGDGEYVLRLSAGDGDLQAQDDVRVLVARSNDAPVVGAGPDQTVTLPANVVAFDGTVTDDGLPVGSSLRVTWRQVSGPAPVLFSPADGPDATATFSDPGLYVLRLEANDSLLTGSDDVLVAVQAAAPTGDVPAVVITSPPAGATVTEAVNVVGSAESATLASWRLEYRLQGDPTWTRFAGGTEPVSGGVLATFDPTLLLNGIYEVRLVATDISGRSTTTSFTAVVKGEQKVGNFSISFVDLEVPVSGLPIRVVRTYDSRDKRTGDFGVGWRLDLTSVRLDESTVPGLNWDGTKSGGLFPTYCLEPARPHTVAFTLPDGRVQQFEMVLTPTCQVLWPPQMATVSFRATEGTVGSLAPASGDQVWAIGGWPGAQVLYDDASFDLYDPDLYRYTSPEGDVFLIHQQGGLQSVTDANGNRLVVSAGGIQHSSGKGIRFTRDGQGRITSITDPLGNAMAYAYDARGDLVAFTDREAQTTRFTYNDSHHLLDIEDPRGVRVARTEYDDQGRVIRHIDAFGNVIQYQNDLGLRQQVVTDRLGHVRVMQYDPRGNLVREVDAEGGVTTRTFDARNNPTSETDPNGHTTAFTYDAQDNVLSERDALGNTVTRTYNARRQVLTLTDARGKVSTNTYDAESNVIRTRDALGHETTYTYDDAGNALTRTDPLGCVTRYEYDSFGNLTRETDALGHVTTYTYDANSNRLTETTTRTVNGVADSVVTTFAYDKVGRLVQTTYPDGSTVKATYDAMGRRVATLDRLGRETRSEFDALGRLARIVFPDGVTGEATHDDEGRVITTRDRAGRSTSYTYDRVGRLLTTTYPDGTSSTDTYDAGGRLIATRDAAGGSTRFEYDAAGRRTKTIDPLGNATEYGYDANGNEISVKDAKGQTTTHEYDDLNRKVRTVFPGGTEERATYDATARVLTRTDQAGRTTQLAYDCLGRLLRVTDALGQVTVHAYDEMGNRVSQTDANGHATSFDYDRRQRPVRRTLPGGALETMAYDAQGNLTGHTDFLGRTTTYSYDSHDRLLERRYPDGSTVATTYTPTGQRASVTDGRGVTTYTYDLRDRMLSAAQPDGRKLDYAYDAEGRRTRLAATVGSSELATTYAYDAAGRLVTVTDPQGRAYTHGYDANGNRVALVQPNGTETTYTYDALNRLLALGTTHPDSGRMVQSYAFTLGPAGNRLRIDEHDLTTREYAYDALYRLTGETVRTNLGPVSDDSFRYDPVGNRLERTRTDAAGIATTASAYDVRDRLLSAGDRTYGWDQNGNLTSRSGGSTYVWDFDQRLREARTSDGTVVEEAYDADGNRVEVKVTPATGPPTVTRYLVDTTCSLCQVVAESDDSGALTAFYVRGHDLLSVLRPDGAGGFTSRFYHADGIGSVRRLTDETGNVTDGYTYSAFGELVAHTGSDPQPFAFTGEPYDPNLGFYQNRARWLDPDAGRFLSADPFLGHANDPQSLHQYTYAHLDPVNRTDPSGLQTIGEQSVAMSINTTINSISRPAFMKLQRELIKKIVCGAGVATLRSAMQRANGHHPIPKFVGGNPKQYLIPLNGDVHHSFHVVLHQILKFVGLPGGLGGKGNSAADFAMLFSSPGGAAKQAVSIGAVLLAAEMVDRACKLSGPASLRRAVLDNLKAGNLTVF